MNYTQIFCCYNGPPPWLCYFCHQPVVDFGRKRGYGHVHHKDEDRSNNDPANLVIVHPSCHIHHHRHGTTFDMPQIGKDRISAGNKGKPKSLAHRAAIKVARQHQVITLEHRKNISRALKGRPKSSQTRQRMSEAQKGHEVSLETREKLRQAALAQHQRKKHEHYLDAHTWSI